MMPEEREQMNRLCKLIQAEGNHKKLSVLVRELNGLLEKTEH
jgi:hypothetical protein